MNIKKIISRVLIYIFILSLMPIGMISEAAYTEPIQKVVQYKDGKISLTHHNMHYSNGGNEEMYSLDKEFEELGDVKYIGRYGDVIILYKDARIGRFIMFDTQSKTITDKDIDIMLQGNYGRNFKIIDETIDTEGNVWIVYGGSDRGKLFKISNFTTGTEYAASEHGYKKIESDNDNNIFVLSNREIIKIDKGGKPKTFTSYKNDPDNIDTVDIMIQPNGNMWVINNIWKNGKYSGIFELDKDGKKIKDLQMSSRENITMDKDGNLWGVRDKYIEKLQGKKFVQKYTINLGEKAASTKYLDVYEESNPMDYSGNSELFTAYSQMTIDKDILKTKYSFDNLISKVIQEEDKVIVIKPRAVAIIKNDKVKEYVLGKTNYDYFGKYENNLYFYDSKDILKLNVNDGKITKESSAKLKEKINMMPYSAFSASIDPKGNKWINVISGEGYKLFRVSENGIMKDYGKYKVASDIFVDNEGKVSFVQYNKKYMEEFISINEKGTKSVFEFEGDRKLTKISPNGDIWTVSTRLGYVNGKVIHLSKTGKKIEEYNDKTIVGLELDKKGNPWIIVDDTIKKFNGKAFTIVYKIIDEIHSFSVLDENKLVVQLDSGVAIINTKK